MIYPLNLFIHAASAISLAADGATPVTQLAVKEPDYTGLIPPMQLRRMSKVIRTGVAAANACLKQLNGRVPDSISVGTAYGCLQDTEVFLAQMIAQEEQMLSPTPFIQSTHNTVAGQIALLLKAHGRNLTFAQRGHSLEHAMLDAQLHLQRHPEDLALVGGIDELSPAAMLALQQAGVIVTEPVAPAQLYTAERTGTIAGEGAAFFAAGNSASATGQSLHISSLIAFQEKDCDAAARRLIKWLQEQGEIQCILTGESGDVKSNPVYAAVGKAFSGLPQLRFKHLCGEYPTASGFALAMLAEGTLRDFDGAAALTGVPSRVALINHHGSYWSGWMTNF